MKKFLYSLAAMLLITGASTMWTSCGDDNDEPDAPTTKTVKEAQLDVALYVNQEMADTYDITAKTSDGKELTLSSTPVEVDFNGQTTRMYALILEKTADNVPVRASMSLNFSIKEGYQVPQTSNFAYKISATGTLVYTDGTNSMMSAQGFEIQNTGVMGDKINDYTANLNKNYGQINANFVSAGIEVDTNSAD